MPLDDGSNGQCAGKIRSAMRSKIALQNKMIATLLQKLLFPLTMKNAIAKISFCVVDMQSYRVQIFQFGLNRSPRFSEFAASFLGNAK
jgi:hypothetical protein